MPCRATVSTAWQPVWTTTSPNLSTSRRARQCWPDGWRRRHLPSSLPCEHLLNSAGEFVGAPGFCEECVNVRAVTAGEGQYPVAEMFEHDLPHMGHCSFIIDQQDIALPPR